MLFASGVVAGEALVGVGIAMLIGLGIEAPEQAGAWREVASGIAALAVVIVFARATWSPGDGRASSD